MKNPYERMKELTPSEIGQGMVMQASLFVIVGAGLYWLSDRAPSGFLSVSFEEIGMGLGLGLVLIALAAGLFKAFPRYAEALVRQQAPNFAFLENRLSMCMIVFISICAGVGEEALFRAGLQTLIGDYVPAFLAIALASFVFTVIHFAGPAVAAIIFLAGVTFGVFYEWSGSLLAVMIGHALYDVYAFWHLQNELHRLNLFEPGAQPLDLPADSG